MKTFVFLALSSHLCLVSQIYAEEGEWQASTPLETILSDLGATPPNHTLENPETVAEMAMAGQDLFFQGQTKGPDGVLSPRIAPKFVCSHCHSVEKRETARYPGSSLYGVVNRRSFYNGIYIDKYGPIVVPARQNLRKAIEVCAKECSRGRALKDWETESLLAYFWQQQLTLGDLDLTADQLAFLKDATVEPQKRLNFLRNQNPDNGNVFYLDAAKATQGHLPNPEDSGLRDPDNPDRLLRGDRIRGQSLFESTCLTCHNGSGPAESKFTGPLLAMLAEAFDPSLGEESLYSLIRKGIDTPLNRPTYMPFYTEERLSDQEVEDIRAYLKTFL